MNDKEAVLAANEQAEKDLGIQEVPQKQEVQKPRVTPQNSLKEDLEKFTSKVISCTLDDKTRYSQILRNKMTSLSIFISNTTGKKVFIPKSVSSPSQRAELEAQFKQEKELKLRWAEQEMDYCMALLDQIKLI